jgi:hypothetical protein
VLDCRQYPHCFAPTVDRYHQACPLNYGETEHAKLGLKEINQQAPSHVPCDEEFENVTVTMRLAQKYPESQTES